MQQNDTQAKKTLNINLGEREKLRQLVDKEFRLRPPTIGVVGTSGVGKSFTINQMFNTNLPINDVAACTKEFRRSELAVDITGGGLAGEQAILRLIDAPGLGESIHLDPKYLSQYHQQLPRCDVILWVLTARNRTMALEQMYLDHLADFSDKMVFGINQVDLIEPLNWNQGLNIPSHEQLTHIATIEQNRKELLASILGHEVELISYSAKQKFHLQKLFTALIQACPQDRSWLFSAVKNFGYLDFLPDDIREPIKEQLDPKSIL